MLFIKLNLLYIGILSSFKNTNLFVSLPNVGALLSFGNTNLFVSLPNVGVLLYPVNGINYFQMFQSPICWSSTTNKDMYNSCKAIVSISYILEFPSLSEMRIYSYLFQMLEFYKRVILVHKVLKGFNLLYVGVLLKYFNKQ